MYQIEKVPRGIQGEKSSKDMGISRNLEHKQVTKGGGENKCPEGYALPAGMPHS